ncbi:MAG: hypothetical protein ACYDBB_02785 [Armatimonadota bacterium]
MRTFADKDARHYIAQRNMKSIRLEATFTPVIPSRRQTIDDALLLLTDMAMRARRSPDSRQNDLTSFAP